MRQSLVSIAEHFSFENLYRDKFKNEQDEYPC